MKLLVALFFLVTAPVTLQADTTLFHDDFESGSLDKSKWYNPGNLLVTENPKRNGVNPSPNSLVSPGAGSRGGNIFTLARATTPATGVSLQLSFLVNADNAGDKWWSCSWYLQSGESSSAKTPAYGFVAGGPNATLEIVRLDSGFYSDGPSRVTLAKEVSPTDLFSDGWNRVTFSWQDNGTLTLEINGRTVLTASDKTNRPAVQSIAASYFTNNNKASGQEPSGRCLFFDDVSLTSKVAAP